MARVSKDIRFAGTIDDICFYQWGDRTFMRKKSSLTKDRVLKDKEFAGTRKHASDMGRASKIASEIYRLLPADIKGRWIFRAIAGDAASLLYKGKEEEKVKDILHRKYVLRRPYSKQTINPEDSNKPVAASNPVTNKSTKQANKEWKKIFEKRWEQQGKDVFYFERTWSRGVPFKPITIPRRSEYFMGLEHAWGFE